MSRRRLAAVVALVVGAATVVLAVVVAVSEFPRGLGLLGLRGGRRRGGLVRRAAARRRARGGAGGRRPGARRRRGAARRGGPLLVELLVVGGAPGLAGGGARHARRARRPADAPRPAPAGAVLQPASRAAARRSASSSPTRRASAGSSRSSSARRGTSRRSSAAALDRGADALAMAGGDGSQAIVAAIAAERGLPYACIPAGTRNHFALDLGVDRDDVVGALDAFVDGGERTVDLAEVNGRVFVNNVSLGLYAEAVQREGYRDAKLRTLLDTVPDVLGPDGGGSTCAGPARAATTHHAGAAVLVSNNRYRLGRAVGSGTRPRIDDGLLGITVFGEPTGARRGRPRLAAAVARVVGAGLRGRIRSARPRRRRRRGARARPAAALPHPARSPARADRAQAPGRLALGHRARGASGPAWSSWRESPSAAADNPPQPSRSPQWT